MPSHTPTQTHPRYPKRSQVFDSPQLDQVKYKTPSAHQGATYQSLGWNPREWRRALSLWSQKDPGSRNTNKQKDGTIEPQESWESSLLPQPKTPEEASTWRLDKNRWKATHLMMLRFKKARSRHLNDAPFIPTVLAPRTLTASKASSAKKAYTAQNATNLF